MIKRVIFFVLIFILLSVVFLLTGCDGNTSPQGDNLTGNETAGDVGTGEGAGANTDASGTASGTEADTPGAAQTGDNAENTPEPNPAPQTGNGIAEGFIFEVNDVDILMAAPALPIIEQLGEPLNYFEAPSCAFDGVDKSWFYQSFEVHAYPENDDDFILSVILLDDIYGTEKFVYIGMTYDDMVAAYGNGYEQYLEQFKYTLGGTSLSFIIAEDTIISIAYRYEDAPEL